MTVQEKKSWQEIITGIIFIAFGIVVFKVTQNLPSAMYDPLGPAFMPRLLGFLCALIACVILFHGIRIRIVLMRNPPVKETPGDVASPAHTRHPVIAFFSIILFSLYILALDAGISGFRTLTIIFVLVFGGVLIKTSHNKGVVKQFSVLVVLALVLSFGLFYLFTQVFIVDLY
jgi:hypothetical protein